MKEALFGRKWRILLLMAVIALALAACGRGGNDTPAADDADPGPATQDEEPAQTQDDGDEGDDDATVVDGPAFPSRDGVYVPPPRYVEATITVASWGGDGRFIEDIGRREFEPEYLSANNHAQHHIAARIFNERFPNVQVNSWAESSSHIDNSPLSWLQHRTDFEMEHGIQIDIWAVRDMANDIERGLVADLSVFDNDPMFHLYNPGLISMFELEGHVFGVPHYGIPWGIFVNRSLAEAQNIDPPPVNWTLRQYTEFTSHSAANDFYGAMGIPMTFINSATRDVYYQMLNRGPGDPFVTVNSPSMRSILELIPTWANHAVWPQYNIGNITDAFMDEFWWWGWEFFGAGRLLTLDINPYMVFEGGFIPGHWAYARVDDWDMYPRPSTDYIGNHIGLMLGGMSIRNFAMDDGNPELSDEEYLQLALAWEFVKILTAETRFWEESLEFYFYDRVHEDWSTGEAVGVYERIVPFNGSFPFVIGPDFDAQMAIWYQVPMHRHLLDMPGHNRVVELWEQGAFYLTPWTLPGNFEFEGEVRNIMHEWWNMDDPDIAGARMTDPNWLDQVFARLPDWEAQFNQRFEDRLLDMYAALDQFYR